MTSWKFSNKLFFIGFCPIKKDFEKLVCKKIHLNSYNCSFVEIFNHFIKAPTKKYRFWGTY